MKVALAAVLICGLVGSSAAAQAMVQATFPGRTASQVTGLIASSCIDRSMSVVTQNPTEVVCEAHLNFAQRVMVKTLLGNAASSEPRELYRFALVSVGGGVRVQASEWVETTLPLGQRQSADLDDAKHRAAIQTWLVGLPGAALSATPRFDKNGDPLPIVTNTEPSGAPNYQAMLADWRGQPSKTCDSPKLEAAGAEAARRQQLMLHDELSPDQGLKPPLDVADAYLEARCWDRADAIYRGIIRMFTDQKFEAFRQRAVLGIDDVRAGRASGASTQIASPSRP